jgi:selenoprotein W-related protein
VSAAEEVLEAFEPRVEGLTLIPSDGGRFEVEVDGDLIYSKLQTRRHVEPGELVRLIHEHLKAR